MQYLAIGKDKMPVIGLGTWRVYGGECYEAVKLGLELGYRHIDTAQLYDNEQEVGRAIEDSGVDRKEIFLTTKLWIDNLTDELARSSFEESIEKLRTDYVDLLLIHGTSPNNVPVEETLTAMKELSAKHIGVSNFPTKELEEAMKYAKIECNQCEYHPYLNQNILLDYCQKSNVIFTAYCPVARGKAAKEPVIEKIAAKHGKMPAQATLRWLIQQKGVVAIPKSTNKEHLQQNLDVFDFELTDEEMQEIKALAEEYRICDIARVKWD